MHVISCMQTLILDYGLAETLAFRFVYSFATTLTL
jgi:hypothetical protein